MRPDGTLVVENACGEVHKLGVAHVPIAMVYRDGKYMLKLAQTHQSCECLGLLSLATCHQSKRSLVQPVLAKGDHGIGSHLHIANWCA